MALTKPPARAHRDRARRVRRFLLRTLIHAFWWDLVLNRPLLRWLRPDPMKRWQRIARHYRALAVEHGGVLIKLGQFLSARLDVIPAEIAAELAELQDEVPAAPYPAIVERIESCLGGSPDELFSGFDRTPVGAASLAQVHAACLADGRRVVVKVLRPDIEAVVETDLASFAFGTRWLKLWGRLRQRVDVDWLHREFAAVTRRELDLTAEGRSAERFARDMADESDVLVPAVVWELSGVSVLTMDNVTGLKIGDAAALANAGIDGASLARRLYQIYMRQFFVTHFIHADPHPGNLFVHPAVTPPATDNGPPDGDPTSPAPFKIAFVDFGMTTEVPERLRAALREFAIGLGTRDARRLVMSYVEAGTLLPGADIERLVAAHEAVLDRFWGVPLAELRDVALSEGQALAKEFSDLVFSAPVQLQADMVFSLRAVGLLAGLCSRLDPAFDPWQETIPFARRFARDAAPGLLDGAGQLVRGLVALPTRIERALDRAERGQLTVQSTWSPATTRQIEALTRSIRRLGWLVASGALLISGTLVRVLAPGDPMSLWMLTAAGLCAAFALLRGR